MTITFRASGYIVWIDQTIGPLKNRTQVILKCREGSYTRRVNMFAFGRLSDDIVDHLKPYDAVVIIGHIENNPIIEKPLPELIIDDIGLSVRSYTERGKSRIRKHEPRREAIRNNQPVQEESVGDEDGPKDGDGTG